MTTQSPDAKVHWAFGVPAQTTTAEIEMDFLVIFREGRVDLFFDM